MQLVLGLLAFTTILAGWASAQSDNRAFSPSRVGEGCLLYRSPFSGRYETVPLVHTDVAVVGILMAILLHILQRRMARKAEAAS